MSQSQDLSIAQGAFADACSRRRVLLADMARVQARYVLRLGAESGRPPAELIAAQTPWRGRLRDPAADWPPFLERAAAILAGAGSEETRAERLAAFADPFFADAIPPALRAEAELTWFGDFRYTEDRNAGAIALHIANRGGSGAGFSDRGACFAQLRLLCADARRRTSAVAKVVCGSWLNDRDDFLALFPPSYRQSLGTSSPDDKTGWGWWGQLVNREGRLHARRAARLLASGDFPHPRLVGECRFDEFQAHVEAGGTSGGDVARK
jgi:hypothetical protein